MIPATILKQFAPWGFLTTTVALGFHFGFRSADWQREWIWYADLLAFSYLLVGPSAAAVACFAAGRLSRDQDLVDSADAKPIVFLWATMSTLAGVAASGASTFLVFAIVVAKESRDVFPDLLELSYLFPAISIVILMVAVGALLGMRVNHWVMGPVAAVCWFAVSVMGFVVEGLSGLFFIGGANSSLVGLSPSLARVALQTCGVLALAFAAVLFAVRRRRHGRPLLVMFSGGVSLVVGIVLCAYASPLDRFDVVKPEDLVCSDSAIPVCVDRAYQADTGDFEVSALRLDDLLKELALPRPERYSQGGGDEVEASLEALSLESTQRSVKASYLSWVVGPTCDIYSSSELYDSFLIADQWLESNFVAIQGDDGDAPQASSVESMSQAMQMLERCGR